MRMSPTGTKTVSTTDPDCDMFVKGEYERQFTYEAPKDCRECPCRKKCGANEKGQKILTRHIWQEHLDLVEQLRKTDRGKEIYAMRKETIERVFADAKEKHAMRYTHHRGLARVTNWVRLKFVAINLKKLANWSWDKHLLCRVYCFFSTIHERTAVFKFENGGSSTG